jgi:hypothetical protein
MRVVSYAPRGCIKPVPVPTHQLIFESDLLRVDEAERRVPNLEIFLSGLNAKRRVHGDGFAIHRNRLDGNRRWTQVDLHPLRVDHRDSILGWKP